MIELFQIFPFTCGTHKQLKDSYCNTCKELICGASALKCGSLGHDVVAYDAKYKALEQQFKAETGTTFNKYMFRSDFIEDFDRILADEKARLQKPPQ